MPRFSRLLNCLIATLLLVQVAGVPIVAAAADLDWSWQVLFAGPPDETTGNPEDPVNYVKAQANDISFAASGDGWAVGQRTDTTPTAQSRSWVAHWNGSEWTSQTVAGSAMMRGVYAVDSAHVFAVGDQGLLWKWNGSTWATSAIAAGYTKTLYDITFADSSNGWAVGTDRRIFRTTNGGTTWALLASPNVAGKALYSVTANDSGAWAVGDGGVTYRWTGSAWELHLAGTTQPLKGVDFVDGSHGWAVGDESTFRVTTDGGLTWSAQTAPPPTGFTGSDMYPAAVDFTDTRTGVVVGNYAASWRTTNGGATWVASQISGFGPWVVAGNITMSGVAHDPSDASRFWVSGYDGSSENNTKAYLVRGAWTITRPNAPSSLVATSVEPGGPKASLTWHDNASDEVTYSVERAIDTSAPAAFTPVAALSADGTSYADASVSYGHTWYYRVRCSNRGGHSDYSPTAAVLLESPETLPPVTTSNMDSAWHRSFEVTFSVNTTPTTTYYTRDGGGQLTYLGTPVLVNTEGTHDFSYWSINSNAQTETTKYGQVKIDLTAPHTSSDASASYLGTATVHLTPSDALSDVAQTAWWLDGGAQQTGQLVQVTKGGDHTLRFRSVDFAGNVEDTHTATFTVTATAGTVDRVSGSDRYVVAANLAAKGWNTDGHWGETTHVVVACGEAGKEPDPLAAAGLAGVYSAPILLTKVGSLPSATRSTIASMAAAHPGLAVHIVGGTASVPDARWNNIKAIPGVSQSKDRIAGADRYAVTANIASQMASVAGTSAIPGVLIICSEKSAAFYDALAASPIAYRMHMPMLGVKTTSVPSAVLNRLKATFSTSTRYVVSSSTYISAGTYKAVVGSERLATNSNMYTAAAQIADKALSHGWLAEADTGVAAKLPDALGGGAFMGDAGGVMLYTTSTPTMHATTRNWITNHAASISRGWVFGGTTSFPAAQETQFRTLLQ
jgi:photosystem II stability/assembly factor-like uncharacterized protein/putative cell wall-binding protein